jgi:hypothetical protein
MGLFFFLNNIMIHNCLSDSRYVYPVIEKLTEQILKYMEIANIINKQNNNKNKRFLCIISAITCYG